jgi:putative pantetheine hydrolase
VTAPRRWGCVTDVPGISVGHADRTGDGWLTGVTVVLPPPGTTAAVDVRGGGPATHETDALSPTTLVPTVDAICLTGGSAYGLAAAGGVQRWCEENGRGFGVGPLDDPRRLLVPVVPAAAVFDLGRGGDPSTRPDAVFGYSATIAAAGGPADVAGSRGAGTGTLLAASGLRGGVGTASVRVRLSGADVVVGAVAVVNAAGSPVDERDGSLLGRAFVPAGMPQPRIPDADEARALLAHLAAAREAASAAGGGRPRPRVNTTLVVVATDAALDPAGAWPLAAAAHDGLARGLRPIHTLVDGDAAFALSTGAVPVAGPERIALQAAAADATVLAVMDAVLAARTVRTPALEAPGYLDLCPSAAPLS